ncbi:hypothetical protein CRUP_004069 [Coryphaenoides rupestris]|nr:hypothetical protein CRUP_004069 [Coryphaenoides rupestris]
MEEGTDQNENDHKQENKSSELESDNVNNAIAAILSKELVECPSSLHDEETDVEEEGGGEERNPTEPQDTPLPAGHPGAPEGDEAPTPEEEEAGEPPGDPEGAQQQEHDEDQNHDPDDTATRPMSPSLLVLDGASGLEALPPSPPPGMLSRVDSVVTPGDPEERETSSSDETPLEGNAAAAATVDEEEEEEVKRGVDDDDIEAYAQVYEQLCAERDQLTRQGWLLQTKLAENSALRRCTEGDAQSEESGGSESHPQQQQQQQQQYERLLTHLGDLKWSPSGGNSWPSSATRPWEGAGAGPVGDNRCVLAREQERVDDLVALRLANATPTRRRRRREEKTKKKNKNRTQQTAPNRSDLLKLREQQKEQQAFSEKTDEDLLKIRKSITSTMEVTVHIKEDLQWIQAENQAKRAQLAHWEGLVAQKRDLLTDAKRQRKRLRSHALELRQRCGMLGNVVLLRDFEDQTDACGHLEGEAGGDVTENST